jgi:hypothetical protein
VAVVPEQQNNEIQHLISNLQSIDKLEIFLFPFLVFVELNM